MQSFLLEALSFFAIEEEKMNSKNISVLFAIMAILCMVFASSAMAHKVNIFAYVENGIIYAEGYFPDGRAVENGGIEVLDSKGNKLAEGKTDSEGKFSCPVPKKDDLTIVINASMGHKNTFTLKKGELE